MKLTATLAAALGALVVLSPLSLASESAEARSLSVGEAGFEARGASECGLAARKHHHKGKKHRKAKHVKATVNSLSSGRNRKSQHKTSSARPSHYYSGTKESSTQPESYIPVSSSPSGSSGSSGSTSTGSTGSAGASGSSSSLSSFEKTMLDMHNADRAKHSASALTWDSTLASAAAKWAAGCQWKHTPNNPYGQNIAAGTAGNFGAKDSCNMWYDEVSQYNFASGAYSDATGHFTQMVWKSTKKLGCAIQDCSASQMGLGSQGSATYVVCNYDPPGNVIGQFLQNVFST